MLHILRQTVMIPSIGVETNNVSIAELYGKAASDNAIHMVRPVVGSLICDNDDYCFFILVTIEEHDIASRKLEHRHGNPR